MIVRDVYPKVIRQSQRCCVVKAVEDLGSGHIRESLDSKAWLDGVGVAMVIVDVCIGVAVHCVV